MLSGRWILIACFTFTSCLATASENLEEDGAEGTDGVAALRASSDSNHAIFNKHFAKDAVIQTFRYKNGIFNIWKERSTSEMENMEDRFYVTPLAELIADRTTCHKYFANEYTSYALLTMSLWNDDIALSAHRALSRRFGSVSTDNILPLPITNLRLTLSTECTEELKNGFKLSSNWKTNTNERIFHIFKLYTPSFNSCLSMINRMKSDPLDFEDSFVLEISLVPEVRSRRVVKVKSMHITGGELYQQLESMNTGADHRYLTSDDIKLFSQEVASLVVADELVTENFVSTGEELKLEDLIRRTLSSHELDTKRMDPQNWNSVFWKDESSRPDRYSDYLNGAVTNIDGTEDFTFNNDDDDDSALSNLFQLASVSSGGLGGQASRKAGKSELQRYFDNNGFKVEWDGEKWVPKSLKLHRINMGTLKSSSNIVSTSVQVRAFPHQERLGVSLSTQEHFVEYNKSLEISTLKSSVEDLSAQVKNLTEQLRTTNQNIPKSQYSLAQNMEQLPKITNLLVNQYSWLSDTSTVNVTRTCTGLTPAYFQNFIASPNFPFFYDSDLSCTYLLTATYGKKIQVSFTDFRTESGYDFLTFYDGVYSFSTQLQNASGVVDELVVQGSHYAMRITFTTDGTRQKSGFWAYVRAVL